MLKTYICHLLIVETTRLRRILRDSPHRQMIHCQQPFRRLQWQTDVLPECLQVYLWLPYTSFVHRMQHRYNFVRRYYNLNVFHVFIEILRLRRRLIPFFYDVRSIETLIIWKIFLQYIVVELFESEHLSMEIVFFYNQRINDKIQ